MLDTVLGLPVHAIAVHAAVVLVPLMAVLTVLVAVLPVVAGNVVVLGSVVVAQQSGEALQHRLPETELISRHADLGGSMTVFMIGLLVASVLVALVRRRSGGLVAGVGVLAVVAAVAATAWVVGVGHTGANAVWKDVIASTTQRGGD